MIAIPHLVGMVHLLPLPGAPGFAGSMDQVVETAVADAEALAKAGFPALLVENYGDVPFFADRVPAETVAGMARAVSAVVSSTDLAVGVNVLRNDAIAALGVAAVTGAVLVRVNVLTGTMYTDQGPVVGKAAEVVRKREALDPEIQIWADVMVKHAVAPAGVGSSQSAADTVERGLADAVIVSGPGTGEEPSPEEIGKVRTAVPKETRVVIGSGATVQNLSRLLESADTVIVGSAVKADGDARNRVDALRAARFVETAREHGLL